jgi:hypothetical protein
MSAWTEPQEIIATGNKGLKARSIINFETVSLLPPSGFTTVMRAPQGVSKFICRKLPRISRKGFLS